MTYRIQFKSHSILPVLHSDCAQNRLDIEQEITEILTECYFLFLKSSTISFDFRKPNCNSF